MFCDDPNQFQTYILAPNKKISRDLIDKIIGEPNKLPENTLQTNNQFIQFLRKQGREYLDRALKCLNKKLDSNLTQWGSYLCRISDEQYAHFSQYQVAYYMRQGEVFKGFTYIYGESMYVGEVKDQLRSFGENSKIIFRDKSGLKQLWHIFEGKWIKGHLKQGIRRTYTTQGIINDQFQFQYKGQFKNFLFDGKGQITKKGKQSKQMHFREGVRVKARENIDKLEQSFENSENEEKNGQYSKHHNEPQKQQHNSSMNLKKSETRQAKFEKQMQS